MDIFQRIFWCHMSLSRKPWIPPTSLPYERIPTYCFGKLEKISYLSPAKKLPSHHQTWSTHFPQPGAGWIIRQVAFNQRAQKSRMDLSHKLTAEDFQQTRDRCCWFVLLTGIIRSQLGFLLIMKFKFEIPISHTTYISGMGISVAPHSLEGNLQKLLCQVGPGTCRTETFRNEIKWKWLEKTFWLNYDKSPAWMNLRHFWMISCFLSQQSNEKTLKPHRSGETGRKSLSSVLTRSMHFECPSLRDDKDPPYSKGLGTFCMVPEQMDQGYLHFFWLTANLSVFTSLRVH